MKSPDKKGLFSPRELRALLWLLPVLAVVSWLVWEVAKPRHDNSLPSVLTDGQMGDTVTGASAQQNIWAKARGEDAAGNPSVLTDGNENKEFSSHRGLKPSESQISVRLFAFDPNTVGFHDLVRLGFTRGEALGIIKYRERGKVFEIPEDFAACYQVSEAMYLRLRPYIRIGEEYRLKPFGWANNGKEGAPSSLRGAEGDATIQDTTSGLLRASSPRNDGTGDVSSLSTPIELNSADSAALISVVGIGEKTVVAIMDYRERLGGFVRAEQLAEVRGVTEQNYERIVTQIFVDTLAIKKLDINFASAKSLATHPYIRGEALRKLLKQRQLKGGWRTVGELKTDDIFTREELERLVPYLTFN